MPNATNYKQVIKHFAAAPKEVQNYFPEFHELVQNYPFDVSISYVFSRVEAAKHMTIYCGIVKLHWTDSVLTREMVEKDHMSRGRFRDLFKTVFGKQIDERLLEKLSKAEAVRDKVAHGKEWTEAQARTALIDILDFATEFNKFVENEAGFKPFGDLRGFKGRKEALPKKTTEWVLRGMGIGGKPKSE
ncbi:hypothetical protein HAP99_11925 [Acidithiobacillus caldus]|jgi:hypothetical protein|uniref:hypothetical protein n=1 Tax=Acidithiobacillus caldus TaxID=33059 RepID=UPI001C07BB03|nr:hypothetical protein [Acidithiobacillus caldus]MBU2783870.1 hypothetical protein [Acidithiobacillus caldus]